MREFWRATRWFWSFGTFTRWSPTAAPPSTGGGTFPSTHLLNPAITQHLVPRFIVLLPLSNKTVAPTLRSFPSFAIFLYLLTANWKLGQETAGEFKAMEQHRGKNSRSKAFADRRRAETWKSSCQSSIEPWLTPNIRWRWNQRAK